MQKYTHHQRSRARAAFTATRAPAAAMLATDSVTTLQIGDRYGQQHSRRRPPPANDWCSHRHHQQRYSGRKPQLAGSPARPAATSWLGANWDSQHDRVWRLTHWYSQRKHGLQINRFITGSVPAIILDEATPPQNLDARRRAVSGTVYGDYTDRWDNGSNTLTFYGGDLTAANPEQRLRRLLLTAETGCFLPSCNGCGRPLPKPLSSSGMPNTLNNRLQAKCK